MFPPSGARSLTMPMTLPLAAAVAAAVDAAVLRPVAVTVAGVFLMIALGATARRRGWLAASADATLLSLFVRLFLPALIVQQVVGQKALRSAANVVAPPVTSFTVICLGFLAAAALLRLMGRLRLTPAGLDTPPRRRTFVMCNGIFNYGYVTIPLVQSLFPPGNGDGTLGVLFVFNVGVEAAVWGVGVTILHGGLTPGWWKRLLSPPILATVLAIGINLLGPRPALWPTAARDGLAVLNRMIGYLAAAAIPVGLLLSGATIVDDWKRAKLRQGVGTIAASALLRLLVLPSVFVALAVTLPLSLELRRVLVLQAAMPAAVFPIVLARHYGGDVGVGLRIVVGTSLLSLLTMPLWVVLGLSLIG